MTISNKEITIYPAHDAGSPFVILNSFGDEGEAVHEELRKMKTADFALASIKITDWNTDLSPWAIPPVYKNDDPFTGGADAYLEALTGEIVPAIISEIGGKPAYIALAGYSLAGLFAVYAMYRTKLFSWIASASGSLWYPGFMDYAKSHELAALPEKLYLSLGNKEARTRNQIMAKVEQNTGDLHEYYQSLGIDTFFELNEGNHFKDAGLRIAKAITWITD